jgi:hypothetical protein
MAVSTSSNYKINTSPNQSNLHFKTIPTQPHRAHCPLSPPKQKSKPKSQSPSPHHGHNKTNNPNLQLYPITKTIAARVHPNQPNTISLTLHLTASPIQPKQIHHGFLPSLPHQTAPITKSPAVHSFLYPSRSQQQIQTCTIKHIQNHSSSQTNSSTKTCKQKIQIKPPKNQTNKPVPPSFQTTTSTTTSPSLPGNPTQSSHHPHHHLPIQN